MIGREGDVRPFDLIRWARQQSARHQLKPLEGHVLLVLATYANRDAMAWPSIRTLATDCGLRPTRDGRNSAVSAAIARLEELTLVWTKQGGHGQPAKRELLFNPGQPSASAESSTRPAGAQPSVYGDGYAPEPSGTADGNVVSLPNQPSALADAQPSGTADQKYQGKGHTQLPRRTDQGSLPATRKASHPAGRKGDLHRLQVISVLGGAA